MWKYFEIFAFIAFGCWFFSLFFVILKNKHRNKMLFEFFAVCGIVSLLIFVILLWHYLQRPPMRTLGETRLWYSLFLSLTGYVVYRRWQYRWLLIYCLFMAAVFVLINYFNPDTYSKTLMPALQSIWFIPHVIVYMIAYAFLAASFLVSVKGIVSFYRSRFDKNIAVLAGNFVKIGFGFLTLGLVFGALWAKVAWGHYWTWDPKETWALITWMIYLVYIHLVYHRPKKYKTQLYILILAFIVLGICWLGINYLPSAQNSVHTYS